MNFLTYCPTYSKHMTTILLSILEWQCIVVTTPTLIWFVNTFKRPHRNPFPNHPIFALLNELSELNYVIHINFCTPSESNPFKQLIYSIHTTTAAFIQNELQIFSNIVALSYVIILVSLRQPRADFYQYYPETLD